MERQIRRINRRLEIDIRSQLVHDGRRISANIIMALVEVESLNNPRIDKDEIQPPLVGEGLFESTA